VTYRVEVFAEAKADIAALPERELQLAALRVVLDLRENPFLGEALRTRRRSSELVGCRRIAFDRPDYRGKPRYRLVYRNHPEDGSIEVVQVISVGLRERLAAYKTAADRLRAEARRRRPI